MCALREPLGDIGRTEISALLSLLLFRIHLLLSLLLLGLLLFRILYCTHSAKRKKEIDSTNYDAEIVCLAIDINMLNRA